MRKYTVAHLRTIRGMAPGGMATLNAHAVQHLEGWVLQMNWPEPHYLLTAAGEVRVFSSLDTIADLLRQFDVPGFQVFWQE